MTPDLQSCPYCGASAELHNTMRMIWWVQCMNDECGAQTRHCGTAEGKDTAIQLWNRRCLENYGAIVSVDSFLERAQKCCDRVPDGRYFLPDQVLYFIRKLLQHETIDLSERKE